MQIHTTHPSFAETATEFRAIAEALAFSICDSKYIAHIRESVTSLLSGEPEIRFFIDGTKNLGHQAASIDLLGRVLEITRFHGEVIVLYADYGEMVLGATEKKIAFLLEGEERTLLKSQIIVQHGKTKIRFIPYEQRFSLPRRARFGFSGGADDMDINYATELRVDWFLRLQPFLWDDKISEKSAAYYETSRIEAGDGRMFYLIDACPSLRDLPLKRPIKTMKLSRFSDTPASKVLASLERSAYAIWPIYGLHHFHSLATIIAFNLVSTALILSNQLRQPIALLSFCPLTCDLSQSALLADLARHLSKSAPFAEQLSNIDDISQKTMLKLTLNKIPNQASFEFLSPEKLSANLTHRSLGSNCAKVIMIQLGPVAPSIFERTLYNSPLPPVIEGQSTANLLLNFGRPYLHILRPEHVIKNAYISSLEPRRQSDLASHINGIVQQIVQPVEKSSYNGQAVEDIAKLVLRMRNPLSSEARYFANLSHWLDRDEHDKLFLALVALHQAMQIS